MKKVFQNEFLLKLIILLFVFSSSGFTMIVKKCIMSKNCCSQKLENCCYKKEKKNSNTNFNCAVKFLVGKLNPFQLDIKNKYELDSFVSSKHTTSNLKQPIFYRPIFHPLHFFTKEKFILYSSLLI